jgi:hypothetical protein
LVFFLRILYIPLLMTESKSVSKYPSLIGWLVFDFRAHRKSSVFARCPEITSFKG